MQKIISGIQQWTMNWYKIKFTILLVTKVKGKWLRLK